MNLRLEDFFLAVFSGVVGVVITYASQSVVAFYRNSKRADIFGRWISHYQTIYESDGEWVHEEIMLSRRLGKIALRSINNIKGYSYSGSCELLGGSYIIGNWRSTKPGAHAAGAFVLTTTPEL